MEWKQDEGEIQNTGDEFKKLANDLKKVRDELKKTKDQLKKYIAKAKAKTRQCNGTKKAIICFKFWVAKGGHRTV